MRIVFLSETGSRNSPLLFRDSRNILVGVDILPSHRCINSVSSEISPADSQTSSRIFHNEKFSFLFFYSEFSINPHTSFLMLSAIKIIFHLHERKKREYKFLNTQYFKILLLFGDHGTIYFLEQIVV